VNLHDTVQAHQADGALGPVRAVFEREPPEWVRQVGVFDRPSYLTGTVLTWDMTRTGNAILRIGMFQAEGMRFDERFKHSEDKDFFKRAIAAGKKFIWCDEAPVFELETADRFARSYHLKRAIVRGNAAMRHCGFSRRRIATSLVAVTGYVMVLPLALLAGHHHFMKYLIKTCDHVGGLLAVAGADLVSYFGGA
jgi:hypothetical protein